MLKDKEIIGKIKEINQIITEILIITILITFCLIICIIESI